jgi:hypothetical protein
MALRKNISGGARYVPLLDREVADGEIVETPDFQSDGASPVVWPEATWELMKDAPPKGKAAADTSGKAAE